MILKLIVRNILRDSYRNLSPQMQLKDHRARNSSETIGGIPRDLYRTWKSRKFDYLHYREIKKLMSINKKWSLYFSDDEEMKGFIHQKYAGEKLERIFQNSTYPSLKADIWRLAKLYESGGAYLDIDSTFTCSFEDLPLDTTELFSTEKNELKDILLPGVSPMRSFFEKNAYELQGQGFNTNSVILNWAFFVRPRHPILEIALETLIENSDYFVGRNFTNVHLGVVNFSGPILLTQAVWKYVLRGNQVSIMGIDFDGKGIFKRVPKFGEYVNQPHTTSFHNTSVIK
jgi:mannosyltransferase OCH1-like enzyme